MMMMTMMLLLGVWIKCLFPQGIHGFQFSFTWHLKGTKKTTHTQATNYQQNAKGKSIGERGQMKWISKDFLPHTYTLALMHRGNRELFFIKAIYKTFWFLFIFCVMYFLISTFSFAFFLYFFNTFPYFSFIQKINKNKFDFSFVCWRNG